MKYTHTHSRASYIQAVRPKDDLNVQAAFVIRLHYGADLCAALTCGSDKNKKIKTLQIQLVDIMLVGVVVHSDQRGRRYPPRSNSRQ